MHLVANISWVPSVPDTGSPRIYPHVHVHVMMADKAATIFDHLPAKFLMCITVESQVS